jgi:hypothetical protein
VTWMFLLVDNCVCDITLLGISFGLVLLLPCLAESRTLFGCCMIELFRLVSLDTTVQILHIFMYWYPYILGYMVNIITPISTLKKIENLI